MQTVNVQCYFVVELIENPGLENERITYHSTVALPDREIRGTVLRFGEYSAQSRIDGFAAVQSISITFNDITGEFKYWLSHVDLNTFEANLYLLYREKQDHIKPLIKGRLSTPLVWDEKERTLSCDLIANAEFKEFGFVPDFTEVYGNMVEHTISTPWPHVFGQTTFRAEAVGTPAETTLAKEYAFLQPLPSGGYPVIPDTDEVTYIRGSLPTKFELPWASVNTMPGELPGEMTLLTSSTGPVRCYGQFGWDDQKHYFYLRPFRGGTGFNIPIYHANDGTGICTWSPVPYSASSQGYGKDHPLYCPNAVVMVGFGRKKPSTSFNPYNELEPQHTVEIPFPMEGFQPMPYPRLKGMYVKLWGHKVWIGPNGEPVIARGEFLARVDKQEDATLYVVDVQDMLGQPVPLTGYVIDYIDYVIENITFQPYTHAAYPRPPIMPGTTTPSDRNFSYVFYQGAPYLKISLEAGSAVSCPWWWPTRLHPITLDTLSSVYDVYRKKGSRLERLIPGTDYNILVVEDGVWSVFYGPPTPGDYENAGTIPSKYWHLVNDWDWSTREECPFCPRKAMFIYRAPQLETDEIWVNAGNDVDTDERIFATVLEKYSRYTGLMHTENAVSISAVIRQKAAVTEVLGQLAFETFKRIRLDFDTCDMVPMATPQVSTCTLSERNMESLNIEYTTVEEVANKYRITREDSGKTWTAVIKDADSIERYGELVREVQLLFTRDLAAAKQWLDYTAQLWLRYNIISFPHILFQDRLVPASPVLFSFNTALNFLDDTQRSLMVHPPNIAECGGNLESGTGVISLLRIQPETWSIDALVEMPIKLGQLGGD